MKVVLHLFSQGLKWLLICSIVGILAGTSSALFLYTLSWATHFRESHFWLLFLLPLAGLLIGFMYHYYGKGVEKGNNLLLEEYENPQKTIPLKMAPLIYIGTILTHFFGGSAGREGTAVQMSTAIADQFSNVFSISEKERKIILIIGISGGFSSVFGTPVTGAIFAIELLYFSRVHLKSILPSFLTAYIAFYTVAFFKIPHTHYPKPELPELHFHVFLWLLFVGILFGLTAGLFSKTVYYIHKKAKIWIKFPPLRPFIGGIIFVLFIYSFGATKYLGLGIPTILASFSEMQSAEVFFLKLIATALILGTGFKGGEVTPLFFIGAALGSALSLIVPLPISMLAAVGFVAVFAGATHTPLACTIMGIELFGYESGIFVAIACFVAYFFSGYLGIYASQNVKGLKHLVYQYLKHKNLKNL